MDIELIEIRDFLAAHPPFDRLPREVLDELPRSLELRYVRRGGEVFHIGGSNDKLHIVRTGAVDITDEVACLVGVVKSLLLC